MKRLGLLLVLVALGFLAGCVPGDLTEPVYAPSLLPNAPSTGDVGTATNSWLNGYFDNINGLAYPPGAGIWVPYVGATAGVDLGIQTLTTTGLVGFGTAPTANSLLTLFYNAGGIAHVKALDIDENSASSGATGIEVSVLGHKIADTYGINIYNSATDTVTAGINKYALKLRSTSVWTGAGSINYALYIDTPTGAATNWSIYSAGGGNYLAGGLTLGTPLLIGDGGTGQITKAAAFDALSPMTTLGDIIFGNVAGTGDRLAGDTTNTRKFLRSLSVAGVATAPVWDTLQAGDVPSLSGSYVPYSLATGNIDLNAKEVTNGVLNAMVLKGVFTNSGVVTLPAWTMGGAITGNNTWTLDSLGHVGIGTASTTTTLMLAVESTTIADNNARYGINAQPTYVKTGAAYTSTVFGNQGLVTLGAANTQNWTNTLGIIGIRGTVITEAGSTGTITGIVGIYTSATIADAANVTSWFGIRAANPTVAGNKLGYAYGIYIEPITSATTYNYAIYSAGTSTYSYFGGPVGYGVTPGATQTAYYYRQYTDPTATSVMADYLTRLNATTGANNQSVYGVRSIAMIASTNTQNWTSSAGMVSVYSDLQYHASGTGTVTSAINYYARASALAAGTTTYRYGVRIDDAAGAGAVGTQYGVHIANLTKGGTNNYPIYSLGGTSYHAGSFTFGASAKLNPTSGVMGYSTVSTALTLGSAGSIIAPYGDMTGAANDAARDVLAGNVNGAIAVSSDGTFWIRAGGSWSSH